MANAVRVLNTIWENASPRYQQSIPQATRDNIAQVGNYILEYEAHKNEFLSALVNRISLVIVSSKMAKNKLANFKKGMIEYGADIEEIFTAMGKTFQFDVAGSEATVYKREQPDVKAVFHRVNRENFYKVTIEDAQIKRAFLSNDGLGKLVASIINTLYSKDNYDEYILMKELVPQYFAKNSTAVIETPKVIDQATAQTFMEAVKQASTDMTFMSDQFNPMGQLQTSEKSEQVLLLHKNVDTKVSTALLAWAFNSNNFDPKVQTVILDDFGSMANIQAVLVDKQWFQVYDKLYTTKSKYNEEGLYTNYWLHHHQLLSTSPFHNAVAFRIKQA